VLPQEAKVSRMHQRGRNGGRDAGFVRRVRRHFKYPRESRAGGKGGRQLSQPKTVEHDAGVAVGFE
jgi:hypothetical protein